MHLVKIMNKIILLLLLFIIWSVSVAFADITSPLTNTPVVNQQPTTANTTENNDGETKKMGSPKTGKSSPVDWLSSFEFWMSFSVLCFGMLVFVIEIIMVKLTGFQPEQTIKLLAVTLIVISTLFIITAGFDSEQIAPAMGLFGTIAGYMLGRASGKSMEAQE